MSEQAVRALWDSIPQPKCLGLCGAEYCGPIDWSEAEDEICGKHGIATNSALQCNKLKLGRCTIYEDRPLVCRLWGAIPQLRCPYGCEPIMSDEQGHLLMRAMFNLPV